MFPETRTGLLPSAFTIYYCIVSAFLGVDEKVFREELELIGGLDVLGTPVIPGIQIRKDSDTLDNTRTWQREMEMERCASRQIFLSSCDHLSIRHSAFSAKSQLKAPAQARASFQNGSLIYLIC